MITDYSSIGTEFIFLNKPVLYSVEDINEYSDTRGIVFSNFDFWTIGPQCKDIKTLIKETSKLLNDKTYYADERKKARELWFGNLTDGGCDSICNFLFTKDGKISNNVKYYKDPEIELEKQLKDKDNIINEKNLIIQNQNIELNRIYNSKGWRLLEKLRKLKNRK